MLFLSWDWEAWCLTQSGGLIPPPERNTALNKGRKCFHCLGAPNNLIHPCSQVDVNTKEYMILIHQPHVRNVKTHSSSMDTTASMMIKHSWLKFTVTLHLNTHGYMYRNMRYRSFRSRKIKSLCRVLTCPVQDGAVHNRFERAPVVLTTCRL